VSPMKAALYPPGQGQAPFIVSHELPLAEAPAGYRHFDARDSGWTKEVLAPAA
jgi:glutathione-independent formaldehyde dehydrogenase